MNKETAAEKNEIMYSWVQTHKEIAQYLLTKEEDQKSLIKLLQSVGITMFNDRDEEKNNFELEVIDPFTFFCYIYKYGEEKRLKFLQEIARKLNLSVPQDTAGIPSANAQKVWLFPYKYARNEDDVPKLWALFRDILDDKVSDDQFQDALNIKSTGRTKLTEGFFYVRPEEYFPIDGPTKPYLKEELEINPSFKSFSDYLRILKKLKEKTEVPFYELSYEAWKWKEENNVKELPSPYEKSASNPKKASQTKYWLYSPGENAEHWEEFYEKGIMGLGWDYIGDLNKYSSKSEIVKVLQNYEDVTTSKKNDATANYQFKKDISVGDIVIVKKGRGKLLGYGEVTSDYYYDENRTTFQKCRKVDWKKKGEWETGFQLALKTLTDVTNYPEDIFEYDQYYERLLGVIDGHSDDTTHLKIMLPLNQILYGPPGTGKTFKLQNEYFDLFTVNETSLTRSQYLENIVSELKWWQVLSIVLLDLNNAKVNTIIEHDVLKAKIKLSNSKSVNPILWSSLQSHTTLDCPNVGVTERRDPKIFFKDDKSNWSVNKEELEQYYPEAISILQEINDYKPSPERYVKNYEFVTFHQSFSYEDFVEGIKPKMEEQDKEVSYEIQEGIFKKLCNKAKADPENQYAIFIDEINRGNVSSIFGELITLIEDDKRIGEENELTVQLPYSKKEFGIPSNLHVIGTMNTADRSVEALDTALRRRFTFEEIIPLPHLLSNISFTGFKLDEVLETINKRIEVLLDRDHCIGHSYFIKILDGDTEALEQTFQNKIIPLLQEYFYHDYEKIALILGEGFIERKEEKVQFATFSQIDDPEILPSFELKKEIDDIEAAVRMLLNRKDEEAA